MRAKRVSLVCWVVMVLFMIMPLAHGQAAGGGPTNIGPPGVPPDDIIPDEILVKFKESALPLAGTPAQKQFKVLHGAEAAIFASQLPGSLQTTLARIQGTVVQVYAGIGVLKVELTAGLCLNQAIETLYRSGEVIYAEPNYRIKALVKIPNDQRFPDQWALNNTGQGGGTPNADINAPEGWDYRTDGSQTIAAVLDTGVDYNCVDLKDNMWHNPKEVPCNALDDDKNGWVDDDYGIDAISKPPDGDPIDDDLSTHHGTACAGFIGAKGNDNVGIAGINWTAKIMALKCLDRYGYGTTASAITVINYALAIKVREGYPRMVMNASWGGHNCSRALYDAIKAARDQGVLFVAAAGNDGKDADACPMYPAAFDLENIISVGASDKFDQPASFSNFGVASVDIFAPGADVLGTKGGCNVYEKLNGTSFAAPHVAGACVLAWSRTPTLTWKQVKAKILNGAENGRANGFIGKCLTEGRLNLKNTLIAGSTVPAIFSVTPARDLAGGTITIRGINFGTTGTLRFQGIAFDAASIVSWTNELITAKIPTGLTPGYGRLTVTTAAGTSRGAMFGNVPGEAKVGQLLIPRGKAANAQVGNNVWLFGGETPWGVTGLVEKYPLNTNAPVMDSLWTMPVPVAGAGAAAIGTKIYVVGGYGLPPCEENYIIYNNLQIFDTTTGTWTAGKPLPIAVRDPAVVSYSSKLYVFGGATVMESNTTLASNAAYVYNPATNTWTALATMPYTAAGASAALYGTTKIWVFGGFSKCYGYSEQNLVKEYDPATNKWIDKPNMLNRRAGAAALNYGTKVFSVHGSGGGFLGIRHGEWFNPLKNLWQMDIYGTEALFAPARGRYSTRIFILGGARDKCFADVVADKYSTNVWAFRMP